MERVRGTKNLDMEFLDMKEANEEARAVKIPFRNLLKRNNWSQFVIGAIGISMFKQLTGNSLILFYAPVFFLTMGFGSGTSLYSSIMVSSSELSCPWFSWTGSAGEPSSLKLAPK
ncbi:Sugar transport protein 14 [Linum perenne]